MYPHLLADSRVHAVAEHCQEADMEQVGWVRQMSPVLPFPLLGAVCAQPQEPLWLAAARELHQESVAEERECLH